MKNNEEMKKLAVKMFICFDKVLLKIKQAKDEDKDVLQKLLTEIAPFEMAMFLEYGGKMHDYIKEDKAYFEDIDNEVIQDLNRLFEELTSNK